MPARAEGPEGDELVRPLRAHEAGLRGDGDPLVGVDREPEQPRAAARAADDEDGAAGGQGRGSVVGGLSCPPRVKIRFLIANAYAVGGTIRTTFNTAAALAERHDVEIVSALRRRDEPQLELDPRVRLRPLTDLRPDH